MENINIIIAFFGGLFSFLSPCVLPLIPFYVTYLTGFSIKELSETKSKTLVLKKSLGFVIGFSIIFIIMGVSVSSLGKIFLKNGKLFREISGIIIIIFGLHTTGLFKIKFLYREKRYGNMNKIKGNFSSILMGMAFSLGWTPCIGPILSSILLYSGNSSTVGKGALLLIAYSLGFAIPFILTAFILDSIGDYIKKLSKYFDKISIISGVLLIIMGILTFTNTLNIISGTLGS